MPSSSGSSDSFATPNARPDARGMECRRDVIALARAWAADNQVNQAAAAAARAGLTEALAVLRALDALAAVADRAVLAVCRPPRRRRPRCGARCRDGHPCAAAVVVVRTDEGVRYAARCRMHGGLSTGPRTAEGRRRALDALARGRARRWSSRTEQPADDELDAREAGSR